MLDMAFVLDVDSLRQLTELLTKEVLEQLDVEESDRSERGIEYSVGLFDGSTISTNDLDEVIALPNSPRRAITSIELSTPYSSGKIRATVRLRNEDIISITYDLRGEDKEVVALSDKLEENFLGLRQWYSFVGIEFGLKLLVGFSLVFILLVICVGVIVAGTAYPNFENFREEIRNLQSELKVFTLVTSVLTVCAGLFLMSTLFFSLGTSSSWTGSLFPRGTFAIGQGVERHKRRRRFRNIVLTCILVPVPVGILVNLIS